MKRRGCTVCHIIEPRPGQWVGGICPSCTTIRKATPPPPPADPKPVKDPTLQATIARLQSYLTRMAREIPNCWRDFDILRADRNLARYRMPDGTDKIVEWPSWCFAPVGLTYAELEKNRNDETKNAATAACLTALAAWRTTQGIYRFDPTVLDDLCDTSLGGNLPGDVLTRLPEWCCYVETPGRRFRGRESFGFFVCLDWDAHNTGFVTWLRIYVDYGDILDALIPIPIVGTLEEGIRTWLQHVKDGMRERGGENPESVKVELSWKFAKEVAPLVSLTLYLCSTNAEMVDRGTGRLQPRRPLPTKTKDGVRVFPAQKPVAWEVAYRLGAAIRHAREAERSRPGDGTHASPRPHVRRAHWHHFWTGQRAKVGVTNETERELVLKWLPPIPVNVEEGLDVVPTVHSVR